MDVGVHEAGNEGAAFEVDGLRAAERPGRPGWADRGDPPARDPDAAVRGTERPAVEDGAVVEDHFFAGHCAASLTSAMPEIRSAVKITVNACDQASQQ
jgi:hypothetical protein